MAEDERDFLRRWSRRKTEQAQRAAAAAAAPAAAGEAPPLPPVESLGIDSDFKAFMHAKVEDSVKRAALKKLFADPRFNVMDGLDIYIDDYSKGEILPDDMLAKLEHAKSTLFGRQAEAPAPVATADQGGDAAAGDAAVAPQAREPGEGDGHQG